ncbi:DDE-1 domain-containing protein [Aphis craccivora]|uniref:DDE-1 domain-containing protein n=1 Tax=Aphis craccivora TaxID=307492 RepID=A0A6G0WXK4_APHCR|nr:DDE-1 domain-containing protein [Aphis craccivora]
MGADGSYMPPMLIFPRVRNKPELIDGGPPGAWAEQGRI